MTTITEHMERERRDFEKLLKKQWTTRPELKDFLIQHDSRLLKSFITALEGEKFPEENGGSKEMPWTEMSTANPTKHSEVISQYFFNKGIQTAIDLIKRLNQQ